MRSGAKRRLLSGGGISALRFVRSVLSCAMLAKSVFFLKTKVLCPAAASSVFFWQRKMSRLEVGERVIILKVLRMGLLIVENIRRLQESIFKLFKGPQLNSRYKEIILNSMVSLTGCISTCLGSCPGVVGI